MMFTATPSRASSTACAWRSWWREPAADSGLSRELAQLVASSDRGPAPAAGRTVDHAEQWADWHGHAVSHPRSEALASERVDPGLAALVTLAVTDK